MSRLEAERIGKLIVISRVGDHGSVMLTTLYPDEVPELAQLLSDLGEER